MSRALITGVAAALSVLSCGGCDRPSGVPADSTIAVAPPSDARSLSSDERDDYNRSLDEIYGSPEDEVTPRLKSSKGPANHHSR